ncbi:hypothetical protein GGR58DRAFT_122500 [Xylaria digitata]|nr:hypothetical protein GGR58DRAFT_122500 [Xylaria digitata]
MMNLIELLILVLFVFFGVIWAVVICVSTLLVNQDRDLGRPRQPRRSDPPKPPSVQHALEQLYTVTERKRQRDYRARSDDAECPICMASFGGMSKNTSRRESKNDLEAGLSLPGAITTGGSGRSTRAQPEKHRLFQPMDDEILKTKQCGHAFHSRCLVTWFLREEQKNYVHHCPLCRAEYYPVHRQSEPKREQDRGQRDNTADIRLGGLPLLIY